MWLVWFLLCVVYFCGFFFVFFLFFFVFVYPVFLCVSLADVPILFIDEFETRIGPFHIVLENVSLLKGRRSDFFRDSHGVPLGNV